MKKHNLFTVFAFILSGIFLVMSGVMIVHSAQTQSTRSTLNVSYVADNVSFSASAFYQLADTAAKVDLVDTSNNNATSVTFTPSANSTTKTLSAPSDVSLTVNKQYVLFTYSFTNTASSGGYCIKVSLTDGTTSSSNVTVKYLASSTKYCAGATPTVSELTSFKSSVNSSSAPTNVYISAQQTKYFYVLVEITNAYLNSNYTSTASHGLVWNVQSTTSTFNPEISTNTVLNMTEDIESDIIITNGATVTINGQGHTIDGSITINSGTVAINNCTIADTVYINGGTTEIQNTTFEETNPSIVVSGGSVTVHSSGDFCGNVVMSDGTFIIYFPEEEGYYGNVIKDNNSNNSNKELYWSETVTNGIVRKVYSLEQVASNYYNATISFGSVQNSQYFVSLNVYDNEGGTLLGSFNSPSGSMNFNVPKTEESFLYIETIVADGHYYGGHLSINCANYDVLSGDPYSDALWISLHGDASIVIDFNCV